MHSALLGSEKAEITPRTPKIEFFQLTRRSKNQKLPKAYFSSLKNAVPCFFVRICRWKRSLRSRGHSDPKFLNSGPIQRLDNVFNCFSIPKTLQDPNSDLLSTMFYLLERRARFLQKKAFKKLKNYQKLTKKFKKIFKKSKIELWELVHNGRSEAKHFFQLFPTLLKE